MRRCSSSGGGGIEPVASAAETKKRMERMQKKQRKRRKKRMEPKLCDGDDGDGERPKLLPTMVWCCQCTHGEGECEERLLRLLLRKHQLPRQPWP